jgi:putative peptidoglycan lipid II flippase
MSIGRHLATVAVGSTTSRLLGFVRDILIAATLGSGPIADSFIVAFRLPNLFRRLLAEGAFNAALVPFYAQLVRRDEKTAQEFVGDVLTCVALLLIILILLAELFMPAVVSLLAPGFRNDPGKFALTVRLARAAFPFLGLATLAAIVAGLLNAMRRFAVVVCASVALNVVLVAALGAVQWWQLAGSSKGAVWLSWAVSVAGLVQLVLCCAGIRHARIAIAFRLPRVSAAVRGLLLSSLPAVLVAGIAQVNGFVGSIVGSGSQGVISYLYYADRLYQLPLGIVGTAIGLVLLPNLHRHLLYGDDLQARSVQLFVLEFSLFLILPAAVALVAVAQPICAVLFERGAFDGSATAATAATLRVYALGLPGYIVAKALQPAYFARQDLQTPLRIALIGVAADFAIAVALFGAWAQLGIAFAAAMSGWLNAVALALVLWRRRQLVFDRPMLVRLLSLMISATAMGAVVHVCALILAPFLGAEQPLAVKGSALAAVCLVGLATYFLIAWRIGAIEPRSVRKALRR